MWLLVGDDHAGNDGQCVMVVVADFSCGEVELAVEGSQEGLEPAPLLFERGAPRQAELKGQGSHMHGRSLARQEVQDKSRRLGEVGVISDMRNTLTWLLGAALILMIGLAAFALLATARSAVQPVADLSAEVGTQIAGILHPTATLRPDPVTIVREVRSLARLETIQYTVEKVITAESGQGPFGFLFGDRLLLVAHGVVIAGIDLSLLQPQDVWLDDLGRVYLHLPDPEIFVATLDNSQTYVYDRETGLLTAGDIDLEAAARRAAEEAIRQAALDDGILEQARLNAENYLYGFLRSLDFADVIFAVSPSDGSAGPPQPLGSHSTPTPQP